MRDVISLLAIQWNAFSQLMPIFLLSFLFFLVDLLLSILDMSPLLVIHIANTFYSVA